MDNAEKIIASLVEKIERRFYGKYRGLVVNNADPERLGRLKLQVPSVLGDNVVTGWAMPCVPYGGAADQGMLFIPDVGAGVWVEFEEGDLEFPIWVGAYWSKPGGNSELPKPNKPDGTEESSVQSPPTRKIIKTNKGHTIQLEDAAGSESIAIIANGYQAGKPHVILLDGSGIKITDGVNGHEVVLSATGITIKDGKNQNNEVVADGAGVTIQDTNGNKVVLGTGGILLETANTKIGANSAGEYLVLGTQFKRAMEEFVKQLNAHTHIVEKIGESTLLPTPSSVLDIKLSTKHAIDS